jgi:hypothetical protein
MSIDIIVFLENLKLPSLGEWSEAISRNGFSFTFPEPINLTKHTGYLPVLLGDEESGFEFFVSDWNQSDDIPDEVRSLLPGADTVVTFNCHEMHEYLTAFVAASVMVQLTDGVLLDPQCDKRLMGQEAIAQAKAQLDAANKKEADEVALHGKLPLNKWAEAFEQTLHRVNPNYRLSKIYRGRLVECVREDETGLFLSQNCVKVHDTYRHCFAVMLTCKKLNPALNSPFVFGSHFDHNTTISHAYNKDYRAGRKWRISPQEWHSQYRATIRGTQQWVETTARSAEQFLFPLYLNRLSQGAERVALLLRDASVFIEKWGISKETLTVPPAECEFATEFSTEFHLNSRPADWNEGFVTFYNALRLADANGFSGIQLLIHRQNAINTGDDVALGNKGFLSIPDNIRNAAIFVRYAEDFLTVRDELPHMIQVIENIQLHHPLLSEQQTSPQKPWWQFW